MNHPGPDPSPHTNLVRYMPLAGIVMMGISIAGWLLLLSASQTQGLAVLAGLLVLGYAGKEAALPVGLAAGAHPVLMGSFIFLVDIGMTCFLYPPLHYAIRKWMARPGFIGQYLRYVSAEGLEKRGLIARYGTFGLFLFMLIPFAINGPLVGAVVGRLMGLRARQIIPTLVLAVGVTTVIWTIIYALGFLLIESINPIFPKLIAVAVILAVIGHGVWSFRKIRRNAHATRAPPIPPTDDPGDPPIIDVKASTLV